MPRPAARRRIARHLFTVLAGLSLILCLAACVLWVRSYWRADFAMVTLASEPRRTSAYNPFGYVEHFNTFRNTFVFVRSSRGKLWTQRQEIISGPHPPTKWRVTSRRPDEGGRIHAGMQSEWTAAGFSWRRGRLRGEWRALGVPWWFVCAATSVAPTIWFRRWRRRRRRLGHGRCTTCGYDLRGSPERCPECGTAVAPPAREGAAV